MSKRSEIKTIGNIVNKLNAIIIISKMTKEDKNLLVVRCDDDIVDADARECVIEHSSRLGLLVGDLNTVFELEDSALKMFETQWREFLTATTTELSENFLSMVYDALEKHNDIMAGLQKTEEDSGSSSYSDYSDSETESTYTGSSDDDS